MVGRSWVYPYSWNDGEIVHLTERAVIVPQAWYDPNDGRMPLYAVEEIWGENEQVRGIVVTPKAMYISETDGPTGTELIAQYERGD